MPLISSPERLAGTGVGQTPYIGSFSSRVNLRFINDDGSPGPERHVNAPKGKGRSKSWSGQMANGTRIITNTDTWFFSFGHDAASGKAFAILDNPTIQNHGWTESRQTDAEYPALMIFVKFIILATNRTDQNGNTVVDAEGNSVIDYFANHANEPIVLATELAAPLESGPPPNYSMQNTEVSLYPFNFREYAFYGSDPITGTPAFPRIKLMQESQDGQSEFTQLEKLFEVNFDGSLTTIL